MNDRPVPSFDPDRLKNERHDVDLGADQETGHDHVGDTPDPTTPTIDDTSGAIPPAR